MVSILLIKTSALGDILQTLQAVQYLRRLHPQAHITWVVEKRGLELVEAFPLIDEIIVIDSRQWRRRPFSRSTWREIKDAKAKIAARHFDMVLDLQGNSKSGLITYFARSQTKVGYSKDLVREKLNALFTNTKIAVDTSLSIREQYVDFVKKACKGDADCTPIISYWKLKDQEIEAKEAVDKKLALTPKSYLIVALGSIWENKMLSSAQQKLLVQHLISKDLGPIIIPFSQEKERKKAQALADSFSGQCFAVGGVSLGVWHALMKNAKAVIGVDSALLHLSSEARVPSFGIFGPSLARVFSPQSPSCSSFQGSCPYGVAVSFRCPRLRSCASGACIKDIAISDLLFHIDRWLVTLPARAKEENLCTLPQYV